MKAEYAPCGGFRPKKSARLAHVLLVVGASLTNGLGQELPAKYTNWLENDVGPIITSAEREVFLSLTNDSSRDIFIREFWECRDPTPGTFRNEYRDEYERRLNVADKLYGRGSRPGWRTDRGLIYTLLGPPNHIDRLTTSRNFYPLEIWYYTAARSAGVFHPINLLFFKRFGVGDYVLYSPSLDGVNALLTPTQSHRLVVRPNDVATREMLEEGLDLSPFEVSVVDAALYVGPRVTGPGAEAVLAKVQSPPRVDPEYIQRYLNGVVEAEFSFRRVPFRASAHAFANLEGGSLVDLAIELPPDALPFEETDKDYYLRLEVIGEIKDRLGVRVDGFEGRVQVRFTPEEVEDNRFFPLLYQQRLLLFPGDYTLDLMVRTPATRAVGHQSLNVSIPPSSTEKMQLSSLLLSYGAEQPESTRQQPFLRDTKLILPRVDRSFRHGAAVYVYYELYLPESREAGSTLNAEYLVMRGKEVVNRETVRLPEATGEPALPVLHPLPLEGLGLGAYTLVVQVTDADRGETVVGEEDFVITEKFQVRGRINAVVTDNLAPTQTETRLGRYWLGRGELGKARDHFEKAYRNEPQSTEARVNLARVLALQGEIKIARDLLSAALAQDRQNVDALLAMAYVQFRLGDHEQAIKAYEHALSVEQTDLAWNGLAELYLSLGETEKALHCLKRSLELNANQPDVASKIRDLQKTRNEKQM